MPSLPVMLAEIAAKPSDTESLFGRLGELLNAIVDAMTWWHRAEGFLACVVLVVLVVLFALVCGATFAGLTWLVNRNK